MSTIILSFLAGTLSVLSPCVLPVLPIVVASALQRHAQGPLVLAAGLVVSSTAVGLFFASLGFTIGVDRDVARVAGGALMATVGIVLLTPRVQAVFARATGSLTHGAGALTTHLPPTLVGQFVLGILLGAVWLPCTGPTLAAAVTLATRGETLGHAGAVMFVFGIGAVLPVLFFAYGSRRALASRGRTLGTIATVGKPAMGIALLLVGMLTVMGADKTIETWVVDRMPPWMLELTTRF